MPEKTFAVFTTKSEFPRRFSLQMNKKMKKIKPRVPMTNKHDTRKTRTVVKQSSISFDKETFKRNGKAHPSGNSPTSDKS